MPLGDTLVAGSISANSGGMTTPAANSTVLIECNGAGAGSVQVSGAGWGGTIILEGRINAVAADWQQLTLMNLAGAPIASITANGLWIFSAAPFTQVRARSTAWAAATANLVLMISPVAGAGTGGGGGGGAVTVADGADVALGTTTDAAAEGDAAGTVNAHLRGIDKVAGATADAAVVTNAAGSLSGKLRGLVAILADVWDTVAHALKSEGVKTNNNAAPGATNLGVLPAIANAAAPTWVEGNQVLTSVDLAGATRVIGMKLTNNAAPTTQLGVMPAVANANAPVYVEGNQVLLSTDLAGSGRVIGTKINNNAAPTTQLGVMPALANAAAPTWVEGNQVLASVDLSGRQRMQGQVAAAAAFTGNPFTTGSVAIALGTNPTAVAAGQSAPHPSNRHGIPYFIGGHPNVITVRANYAAAQTDTAVVTVAAGSRIVVTGFMITASNANTVNVSAVLGFGLANTPTTTGVIGAHPGIAPGSGFGRGAGSAIIGSGADDEDLRITSSVPTSGSIDLCVEYFVLPT